eukprot:22150-Pleurochrysis_carterae.AAC.3
MRRITSARGVFKGPSLVDASARSPRLQAVLLALARSELSVLQLNPARVGVKVLIAAAVASSQLRFPARAVAVHRVQALVLLSLIHI